MNTNLDNNQFAFKKPILDNFSPTPEELRIANEYTRIKFVLIGEGEGCDDAHTAWLVIGCQSFCITPVYRETAEDASWHCWMLAKAVVRLFGLERPTT